MVMNRFDNGDVVLQYLLTISVFFRWSKTLPTHFLSAFKYLFFVQIVITYTCTMNERKSQQTHTPHTSTLLENTAHYAYHNMKGGIGQSGSKS